MAIVICNAADVEGPGADVVVAAGVPLAGLIPSEAGEVSIEAEGTGAEVPAAAKNAGEGVHSAKVV